MLCLLCLHFTLVTLKDQCQGHSDFEGLYLMRFKYKSAENCHLPYQLHVSSRTPKSLDVLLIYTSRLFEVLARNIFSVYLHKKVWSVLSSADNPNLTSTIFDLDCDCLPECQEVYYESSISTATYPADLYIKYYQQGLAYLTEDIIRYVLCKLD